MLVDGGTILPALQSGLLNPADVSLAVSCSNWSLQEIAAAEGKKAALEMSARAVREEHEDLQKELETVLLSVEAAKADVATAQRELRTLRDKVHPLLQALLKLVTFDCEQFHAVLCWRCHNR